MANVIDISKPIVSGEEKPDAKYPPTKLERVLEPGMDGADGRTATTHSGLLHQGTHVDAPLHLFSDGDSLNDYPIDRFVGDGVVADVSDAVPDGEVRPEDLREEVGDLLRSDDILLISADMGSVPTDADEYSADSPFFSPEAAQWCMDRGAKVVGVDFSINREGGKSTLLRNGVPTLTHLKNLETISAERFTVVAAPIKFENVEGSFVRAVVIED